MHDRVGEQFGKYRLTQLIGQGGYAEVYLAEHILLNNLQYAIKILTGTNLKDEKRDEFRLEAQTIIKLQTLSSHIVQIWDFDIQPSQAGTNSGTPYIVMEYAREGTLRNLYPPMTQVPLERIALYIKQIAEALQCAHDQSPPIVHRDIKPENMLLRSRDHVLLSDFGIAVTGQTGTLTSPKGGAGIVGTATYLAPERLSHHTRRASDQYSLGIVVYEWLCGEPPFDGTNQEICLKQLRELPPPLIPLCPQVTPEIQTVVMRALEKDPQRRYATVLAFARALEVAIQNSLQPVQQNAQTVGLLAQQVGSRPVKQSPLPMPPAPGKSLPPPFFVGTTVANTSQNTLPLTPFLMSPVRKPLQDLRAFFGLSSQFVDDRRSVLFRYGGFGLNMLSAVLMGLILQNFSVFCAGLIFSWLMLILCIRAVEKIVATFAGMMVALYWGGVGWVVGSFLVVIYQQLEGMPLPLIAGLLFLSGSVGLHIWYVANKDL